MSSHYNDLPLHFHHLTALVSWTDFTSGEVIATSTAVESVLQQLLNHLVRLSSNEAFFFYSRGWRLYTVFFHKTALNDLLICIRKALPVQKGSRILHLFTASLCCPYQSKKNDAQKMIQRTYITKNIFAWSYWEKMNPSLLYFNSLWDQGVACINRGKNTNKTINSVSFKWHTL